MNQMRRQHSLSRIAVFALTVLSAVLALAAEGKVAVAPIPAQVMSFKQWKTQQIVDAQNQVARFANKSLLIKSSDPNKVVIANEGDNLDELEKQLKQARIRLEVAQGLNFEDYVSIYLGQFAKDKTSLAALASRLSPQDVAEMLEYMSARSAGSSAQGPATEPVVTGSPTPASSASNL